MNILYLSSASSMSISALLMGGERFLGMDLGSGNRSWLHGYVGPALVLDHQ